MWSWAEQIDRLMQSASLPMWSAIAAAVLVALVALIALIRSERWLANTLVLAVIAMAAIAGVAWLTTLGSGKVGAPQQVAEGGGALPTAPSFAPLACLDGLAGATVEAACERVLFASPEAAAAAVSYTAAQIARLRVAGGAQSPDLALLRRALEQDRFGLVARVLDVRDGCTAEACDFFRLLENPRVIAANLTARAYDALVARHAPSWLAAAGRDAPSVPQLSATTGKPTEIEFPSASSIPPVSIMTGEPPPPQPAPRAPSPPPTAAKATPAPAPPQQAKPPRRPKAPANAPVPIAPQPPEASDDN